MLTPKAEASFQLNLAGTTSRQHDEMMMSMVLVVAAVTTTRRPEARSKIARWASSWRRQEACSRMRRLRDKARRRDEKLGPMGALGLATIECCEQQFDEV